MITTLHPPFSEHEIRLCATTQFKESVKEKEREKEGERGNPLQTTYDSTRSFPCLTLQSQRFLNVLNAQIT